VKVSCFLKLEPAFTQTGAVKRVRVVGATQRRPADGVCVRVELDVPAEAFEPLYARLVVTAAELRVFARTLEPAEDGIS
jgi:hypothetical protein